MKPEYYCSEWCIYEAWDFQLIAEVVEVEKQGNCSYCDAQLLAGYNYFQTDLQLSQLKRKEYQYGN